MRVPLFHLVVVGMVVCAPVTAGETRPIPACMVIDDPAPFINMRWVKDKTVCREIPTSFYQELGQWAKRVGVKGKFSVIPCLGGVKPIDGSLGEYPDHSRQERLEWIAMVKTLFAPRFTITPEVITHWYVWDVANRKLLPGPQTENQWLPLQPVETQTQYIAAAMKMLRDVGLEPGGLTMCWSYPTEKEALLGQATLEAAERVCGLKYVMVFNEPGDRPRSSTAAPMAPWPFHSARWSRTCTITPSARRLRPTSGTTRTGTLRRTGPVDGSSRRSRRTAA